MKKTSIALASLIAIIMLWAFIDPADMADQLGKQLSVFNAENPSTNLYLHLDKNVYQPNENIWFKAYALAGKITDSKVIFVRLVDQNKRVVVKGEFPAYDIRAHGNLLIPAKTRNGRYMLYAYTDRMINFDERDTFVQPITIRDDAANMLVAEASVTDTTKLIRGANVTVVVKIKDATGYLKNIPGKYQLLDADTILKTGNARTNSMGEAVISFTYPQLANDRTLQLKASFKRNNDFGEVLLNLHHEGNQTRINSYPEGGQLVAGISNKMVVQAVDINNYPVITDVSLLNGGKVIAQAKTNSQGLAVINFQPAANAAYGFEIVSTGKNATHIPFTPKVAAQGYSLALKKLNGRVVLTIKNKGESSQAILVLRNAEQVISSQQIMVPSGDSVTLSPPLNNMKKQILSAAIFSDEGKLMSERVFMNKAADDYTVALKTDAASYGTRKKVTLYFDVNDSEGKPVEGNFSVAVVEKNTIDKATYTNILNHYYYKALNGNDRNAYLTAKTESDMDALLITKKWWHNSWDNVLNYTSRGPTALFKYADGVAGYLTPDDSPDAAVNNYGMHAITLIGNNQLMVIPLNAQYEFYIPSEKITVRKGKEWNMMYDTRFSKAYKLHFYDYDWVFDRKVADARLLDRVWMFNTYATNKPAAAPRFLNVVQLKEVRIGAKETTLDNDDYFNTQCPDYVCSFGGFYCPRHVPGAPGSELNTSPVIGGIYEYKGGIVAEYRGCNDYYLKNITIPDEFPLTDYDKDPNAEPNFNTTLYWSPNTDTGKDGKNNLSFFTSLLPGDYTIIAQGIDKKTNKPLYGTTAFSVK